MILRSAVFAFSWGMLSLVPLASQNLPPQFLPIHGETGGHGFTRTCAPGRAVVRAGIRHGSYVNSILLFCRRWDAATRSVTGLEHALNFIGTPEGGTNDFEGCESTRQPANVIRGRALRLVDAIGFICDEP